MNNLFKFKIKAFALMTILLVSISGVLSAQTKKDTIAIIDAGSSGSKFFVYEIEHGTTKTAPAKVNCLFTNVSTAALSAVSDPSTVQTFLDGVTSTSLAQVKGPIKLYVLSTAGMREKNKTEADQIYSSMKDKTTNGYIVKVAMTISGRYEGLYAWIAVNYRNGRLGFNNSTPEKPLTYTGTPCGILEIGGASMQIVFAAKNPSSDYISRKGFSNIYSKSYLGCGVNSVYDKDPDKKYEFDKLNMNLNAIKELIPSNTTFWGLGGSIGAYFNETQKDHITLGQYIDKHKSETATPKNHLYMNGLYIKYITECLGLELNNTLIKPTNPSNWTEGAALDILVNKNDPEKYDYATKN